MEIVKEEKKPKKQQLKMTMKIVGLKILIMAVLQIKNFFKKPQMMQNGYYNEINLIQK
jgi:hypothetical protein